MPSSHPSLGLYVFFLFFEKIGSQRERPRDTETGRTKATSCLWDNGHGASAIRVGELQEDPLTRFLLRYDEFETGGELTDGNGKRIKMGKDSEPLRSGKGRALNVKVAQTCLALHVSHQFTHFAATDGGKDREDKVAEDGKYVPNHRVASRRDALEGSSRSEREERQGLYLPEKWRRLLCGVVRVVRVPSVRVSFVRVTFL